MADWGLTLVRDVMTPMPLITGHVGISNDEATLLLRDVEGRVRQDDALDDVAGHPKIAAWRQAFETK